MAELAIAHGKPKRAVLALQVLLDKGQVSTDELKDLGYEHPPRIIGDIKDAGIPILKLSGKSRAGKRMAVYQFGSAEDIREGRIGGRAALPKAFKAELIAHYGSRDRITGASLHERLLQIDHRIPYRVAGDAGLDSRDVSAYMLLDGSSQRAKSFSCEQCENWQRLHDPAVCRACFWAYPEKYSHIAMEQIRRTDLVWQGADVAVHDRIRALAEKSGVSVNEYLVQLARAKSKEP